MYIIYKMPNIDVLSSLQSIQIWLTKGSHFEMKAAILNMEAAILNHGSSHFKNEGNNFVS